MGPSLGQAPGGCGWEFLVLKGLLCEQMKGLEVGACVGVLTRAGIWEGGGKLSHGTTAVLGDRSAWAHLQQKLWKMIQSSLLKKVVLI